MARNRNPVDIKCPRCGKVVGQYRDTLKTDATFSCGECRMLFVYIRDDKTIRIKKIEDQDRVASSGRRFL